MGEHILIKVNYELLLLVPYKINIISLHGVVKKLKQLPQYSVLQV